MVEFRYIDWTAYGNLVSELTEMIRSKGGNFDLVVGIARGGIPVAMVVADQLGIGIDIINVKSYTGIGSRKRPRIISTLTEEIKKKNILVVDDLIDEGDTMTTVVSYLRRGKPERLSTAVLFKKPWSMYEPDYCLEVVDKWVVFPWEHGEVKRLTAAAKAKPGRVGERRSAL